ncbi:MAG: hypothetical protein IH933_11425 [Euryarchaeota archaeon]|jgi:drug/metabolite transporter (DMT)-like permease|nr:hypothetical protein [Euryarchaeota archaeon]
MSVRSALSSYFPNRPPTWMEVVIVAVVAVSFAPSFFSPSTLLWPAVLFGFLGFLVVAGPVANTTLGKEFGDWFQRIGGVGRLFVVFLFVVGVLALLQFSLVPPAWVDDTIAGMFLGIVVYMLSYILLAGGVSGWRSDGNRSN